MMDTSLSIATLARYGATTHARATVTTATETGVRRATYAQVTDRAARLAHALRRLGVTVDQRVATFMWNNQEHLEAYVAIPSMGAVLHPLNIRLPPGEVAFITRAAEDLVVIVDASLVTLWAAILPSCPTIRHVIVVGGDESGPCAATRDMRARARAPASVAIHDYEELLAQAPASRFAWAFVDEREACAICFTSGTTGSPKGVAYSHRSAYLHAMQLCMSDAAALTANDRILPIVPMFHVCAWGLPWAALMIGASLVMPDRFLQPAHLARLIESERPTFAGAVPTIWTALLHHVDANETDLSSLREVFVGGSACPPSLIRAYEERHGVHVTHAWGMTETNPLGAVAHPPPGLDADAAWPYRTCQGRIPALVEATLLGEGEIPVAHDGKATGEVIVRGPWITGRYYPEDDASKFVDGWLRTGDVGSITADGYLTITDRAKDIIKSGGEWISSVDLENRLMGHPEVAEACVIAIDDARWGERPLACVVFQPGATTTFDTLRNFLSAQLPKWQVPTVWTALPTIPKTSVGKFDKKHLRAEFNRGALKTKSTETSPSTNPPKQTDAPTSTDPTNAKTPTGH